EGGEGKPGDLTAVVTGSGDQWAAYEFTSDTSHIAHWLTWERARVEWTPVNDREIRIKWSVTYSRSLDPFWYFGPLERYGVRLAVLWVCFAALTIGPIQSAGLPDLLSRLVLGAALLALDAIYMPRMQPVLVLGPHWIFGETLLLATCFLPSQLIARWTSRDTH